MNDQLHAWRVIERNINCALQHLEELELEDQPRQCRAHTRKGTPCQREPLPSKDYCPSHKHLEESFDSVPLEEHELQVAA